MREYILPIIGSTFLLAGLYLIACTVLLLTINKGSRLYKYLTKPGRGWLEEYMREHLSEKTNRIIQIVICMVFGTVMIVFGLNGLVKGLIDPYGLGFWIIF